MHIDYFGKVSFAGSCSNIPFKRLYLAVLQGIFNSDFTLPYSMMRTCNFTEEYNIDQELIRMKFVRALITRKDGTKTLNLPKVVTDCDFWKNALTVELDFNESQNTIIIRPVDEEVTK